MFKKLNGRWFATDKYYYFYLKIKLQFTVIDIYTSIHIIKKYPNNFLSQKTLCLMQTKLIFVHVYTLTDKKYKASKYRCAYSNQRICVHSLGIGFLFLFFLFCHFLVYLDLNVCKLNSRLRR